MALLTHRLLTFGGPIGDGITGPHFGQAPMAVKVNSDDGVLWAQYEYICAWLARLMGLRCAPVQLTAWEGKVASMSLWIDDPKATPAPVVPADVTSARPADAAGILLFDQWIGNQDRHARNLVWSDSGEVVLIDHSHAFFGAFRSTQMPVVFEERKRRPINDAHCLQKHVAGAASMFDPWLARLELLHPDLYGGELQLLVRDGFLEIDHAELLVDLLSVRRERIRTLMATMLPHLKGW